MANTPPKRHRKITLGEAKKALMENGYTQEQLIAMTPWEIIDLYKALDAQ